MTLWHMKLAENTIIWISGLWWLNEQLGIHLMWGARFRSIAAVCPAHTALGEGQMSINSDAGGVSNGMVSLM